MIPSTLLLPLLPRLMRLLLTTKAIAKAKA
jgi:hypothetical protein